MTGRVRSAGRHEAGVMDLNCLAITFRHLHGNAGVCLFSQGVPMPWRSV
jgi:hypothetical protein